MRLLLLLAGWVWLFASLGVFAMLAYWGHQKENNLLLTIGSTLFVTVLILNILCEMAYRNRHEGISYFEAVFRRPGYLNLSRKAHERTYGRIGCLLMRLSSIWLLLGLMVLAAAIYLNVSDLIDLANMIWPI